MKKLFFLFAFAIVAIFTSAQEKFTPELMWKLGRISEMQLSPDGKTILYNVRFYDVSANKGNSDLYTLPVTGGQPKKLTETSSSEFNAIWRPDGLKIGYISTESGSAQVWEMNPDGSDKKQVTNIDGEINGFSYSPKMTHILFIKDVKLAKTTDEIYPDLPKANCIIIDDLMYRHWDSWFDYTYSHVFYAPYSVTAGVSGNPVDIMENEEFDSPLKPWGGMDEVAWSPDGTKIAYTCVKLKGKEYAVSTNSDIYLYDVTAKNTINLSEQNPGYDRSPVFSPDGKKIAWQSMKTPGYEADKERILYYDFDKKAVEDLTEKYPDNASALEFSPDGKKIYFISGVKATEQVFFVDIKTRNITQVTKGTHDYTSYALAGKYLVGTKMSMSLPTEIFKIEEKTGKEEQITFVNKDILSKTRFGQVEERWINTTDGKKMLTWIIYPPDFDPAKKYPALLYCQGGPQSTVSQFFSYRWNFQLMAAKGYIIVAPNRRGLPSFGQEWNQQISGDYGGQNIQDYLSAIDSMAKVPFVDKDRLGAVGASYGGYSVYYLAGHHNKRFKAFIAHCGMFNLESQYGGTEEMWFVNYDLGGPYWQKPTPKSYTDFSPHKFVGNWDTPILIISGGYDFRIPYTESMQAFTAAQMRGIPSKFLFFPEESHFVLKPQNSILWNREFFGWLDKYLK